MPLPEIRAINSERIFVASMSLIESKYLPPRESGTILGEPLHIDRFLHFSGFRVRFNEDVIPWSSLMSHWWVLLLRFSIIRTVRYIVAQKDSYIRVAFLAIR